MSSYQVLNLSTTKFIFNNKKNSVKLLWDELGPILGKKKIKGKIV